MSKFSTFFLFFAVFTMSMQGQIVVDDSSFTVDQLIEDILVGSDCAEVENITFSTGTSQGFNGIGYFEANGSGFEIERGVILSTGRATSAAGPNGPAPLGEGSGSSWIGDAELETITGTPNLFNATSIQFDFVPSTESINFEFLFASEEYIAGFPCLFSDVFAFILTDSSGNSVNLAVVPDTNPEVPIKVTTVHPGVDLNNDGDFSDIISGVAECSPQNPTFFNRNIPAGTNEGPIDFNGYTQIFTASGAVIPNDRYTIKLVIADFEDGQYDSAVFLSAGSFNLGTDLGEDLTLVNGNPGCSAAPVIIDATLGVGSTYDWLKDGIPLVPADGTTLIDAGAMLEVTQSGVYTVEVTIANGCSDSDSIVIEFLESPEISSPPIRLTSCDDDDDGFSPFDLTENSSLVLGAQNATLNPISYHLTQQDADNYTGATTDNVIANPTTFTNTSPNQIVWVRIAETNQICYRIASFELEVVRNPVANPAADVELCDDSNDGDDTNGSVEFDLSLRRNEIVGTQNVADFSVLFYESQAAADLGTIGTELLDAYTNTSNPQTIYGRIESVIDRNCYKTTSFQLIVNALPVVVDPVALLQCDDDNDGFSLFNLSEANSLLSTNAVNETFSYYLTLGEATTGDLADQISNFTAYPNPIALSSIVFARIESDKGCFRTSQINLQVSATQIPPAFDLVYTICDNDIIDNDDTNGVVAFDFSDATNQIIALYPPQNLVVTYYQNESDALAEENEIIDTSNYRNDASPFLQRIFVRVDDGTSNSCLGLGEHITLVVDPLPLNTTVTDFILCSDNPNLTNFDLTEKDAEIIDSQTENILITYHRTQQEAIDNVGVLPSLFTNESNPQTIWARVLFDDNNNGVGDAGECYRTTISLELQVLHNPEINTPDIISICNDQVDTIYDLTLRANQIIGNSSTITLLYYEDQAAVDAGVPIVNPTTYTNTTLLRDIIVRGVDTDNGCDSFVIQQLRTIVYDSFNDTPTAIETCEVNDEGIGFLDLTLGASDILNLNDADISNDLNASDYEITYYEAIDDAQDGNSNTVVTPSSFMNTLAYNQTIYIRFDPIEVGNVCFKVISLDLIVNELPEIIIEDEYVMCLDPNGNQLVPLLEIDTELDPSRYSFQWFTGVVASPGNEIAGETGASFLPDASDNYTVAVTTIATGCIESASTTVIESIPPVNVVAELISGAFSDNATVQVTVQENGQYEYRIDNGDWQNSNIFNNVFRGEHVVYVRDTGLCNEIAVDVAFVVNYPRYFTPNGDGRHETWGIEGNDRVEVLGLRVFDRHGKLINDLGPSGTWDGTYNGSVLPSSEYWFRLQYTEDGIFKEFSASFSLIR